MEQVPGTAKKSQIVTCDTMQKLQIKCYYVFNLSISIISLFYHTVSVSTYDVPLLNLDFIFSIMARIPRIKPTGETNYHACTKVKGIILLWGVMKV